MESLKDRLKCLRLRGIADNLENRIQQALTAHLSYDDFLSLLVEDQEALKSTQGFKARLKKSHLNPGKTLDNYVYSQQPSVNPKQIAQLGTCAFIPARSKIVVIGISGVGKSHLSGALGLKALEKGYKVIQYNSNDLVDLLLLARKNDTYNVLMKELLHTDMVIIDEMCLLEYPPGGSALLMRLLEKMDERVSVVFTSNRELSDWVPYFPDEVVASAFVDRTIHQATIIRILGNSNRAKLHRLPS